MSFILVLAGLIFNILLYTDFFGNDLQLHTHLPGKVDFLETGILDHELGEVKVELVEASTRIHFFNTPGFIARRVGVALLLAMGFLALMAWIFRSFTYNVYKGEIFSLANIKKLKYLAYSIAAFWLFTVLYLQYAYHFFNQKLIFEHIRFSDDIPNFSSLLFLSLFIWVIAHVFMSGLKLKQEQELTI
jgi:hypothetical protein